MEREIKFRAWDGEKMVVVNDIVFSHNPPKAFWRENSVTEWSVKIMQFTGLKDKNRTDIYDNDIIKDVLTGAIMKVCFGYNRNGGYTGWYCEYLNIDRNGNADINNDVDSDRNSMIEIIGNIHEHPELLKQLEK